MVGMTERFTGARGIYGGPRSPFLCSSWFMVHMVHRTTMPAPPLASPRGGAPAGGERPFSSHGGSSAAFLGSTEDFSARPYPARWPVRLGTLSPRRRSGAQLHRQGKREQLPHVALFLDLAACGASLAKAKQIALLPSLLPA